MTSDHRKLIVCSALDINLSMAKKIGGKKVLWSRVSTISQSVNQFESNEANVSTSTSKIEYNFIKYSWRKSIHHQG